MDTEQQIRLNFLDEAEEYFDRMESSLIGLAQSAIDTQKVDLVLRSAHSIKGGAAMMSFDTLSRVAHRLEDFLKILRVRYASSSVNVEVETLLLQGVDRLRHLSSLNRQGINVTDSEFNNRTQEIFEQLRQHLGELEDADENALLMQDEDIDPAVLIFEEGVDTVLNRFETQLQELGIAELAQEITTTAEELIGFGMMANLESFTKLCQSIQQKAVSISTPEIAPLAEQALKVWRRSHALVLRGSIDKLPSGLENDNPVNQDFSTTASVEPEAKEFLADDELETFDPLEADSLDLRGLQSAFELDVPEESQTVIEFNTQKLPTLSTQKTPSVDKMVRVPVSQLKQFNNLFEQLVLNRNGINLRLQQFQEIVFLMSQRISQMEYSNAQLKKWYDRASLEGFLTESRQTSPIDNEQPRQNSASAVRDNLSKTNSRSDKPDSIATRYAERYPLGHEVSDALANPLRPLGQRFDILEMDRYTDIHLICQEQIETIVQLQEVATDIKLGVQEINLAVRDLNYTTKSMQGNVVRTQMLPFAEAVKRFPRVIRDLNLQFNKQINLKIIGENTLLDRSVIEALSDPLMHLLRNAFDHGIEDPQTRIKNGKSESGTITIQALNQGTYSVITLSDDGSGISLDKIRDRLIKMGISPSETTQIPQAELLNFIFEPGFSTAKQVTELSGRGVGMDVVRTNLQEIRGLVQVATEPGKGTTFTLTIPFALSILKVAVIEQAGIIFAIPANNIRELVPLTSELVTTSEGKKSLSWNQTQIPLVEIENTLIYRRSHNTVNLTGNPAIDRTMALVVKDEKSFAALQISRFWYEQESTIRSIDSPIPLPPGVISSVIFGDGKVIPLVDPALLIKECLSNSSANNEANQNIIASTNLPLNTTILVVDDSINVRRYLSLTLEKAGYRVEQAKDGREAVDKLIGGLLVDAVICDIEMPRLDGYGVLEEIKERAEFEHLPIAMLTSRSNEKHRKLAVNLGASAYFSKPYNEQELLDKLTEIINDRDK